MPLQTDYEDHNPKNFITKKGLLSLTVLFLCAKPGKVFCGLCRTRLHSEYVF